MKNELSSHCISVGRRMSSLFDGYYTLCWFGRGSSRNTRIFGVTTFDNYMFHFGGVVRSASGVVCISVLFIKP